MKNLEMREFTKNDWYAWGGAETIQIVGENQERFELTPQIAYYAGFTIILDNNGICIYDDQNSSGDSMWYNYNDGYEYNRAIVTELLGNIQNKTRKVIKRYLDENFDFQ